VASRHCTEARRTLSAPEGSMQEGFTDFWKPSLCGPRRDVDLSDSPARVQIESSS
jgi:hypothetical protein